MPFFRHKPAEVEARQFVGSNWRDIEVWTEGRIMWPGTTCEPRKPGQDVVVSEMEFHGDPVLLSDWIVKTSDGWRIFNEEVFEARFEPVPES